LHILQNGYCSEPKPETVQIIKIVKSLSDTGS